jgi:hypothetical protein
MCPNQFSHKIYSKLVFIALCAQIKTQKFFKSVALQHF